MTNKVKKVFILVGCLFLLMELGMATYSYLLISPEAVVHNLLSAFGWVVWILMATKIEGGEITCLR